MQTLLWKLPLHATFHPIPYFIPALVGKGLPHHGSTTAPQLQTLHLIPIQFLYSQEKRTILFWHECSLQYTKRLHFCFQVFKECEVGSPDGSVGKESACNAGQTRGASLIPGLGRCPTGGNGNPLQDSCWENPMDRGAWLQSKGSQRVRHDLMRVHVCTVWSARNQRQERSSPCCKGAVRTVGQTSTLKNNCIM